ncbi:MAG: aminotransferase class I/II-fold pyridoxal phosphate-dependent enzyme [Sphingobacteriales bacterium]|nr:MAG: aminotransferase class I/II-fold pyridoxal phosphate-dependent enzyme [Sphingobacteriales bacterium]
MSKLSALAASLVGSEIVKLGNEINNRIAQGAEIYNYTIGDFNPAIFPISDVLRDEIIKAYQEGFTNYPPADGILPLRKAVAKFVKDYQHIDYEVNEIQISCGGRPFIYTLFRTLVDPGDKVIYAVPSWNNNHYTSICQGQACEINTLPENDFMPSVEEIQANIRDAVLLCLCTPQNPTGTTLSKEKLNQICDLVIAENKRRGPDEKKLYVLFDQMYATLTFGTTTHYHPVQLNPAMKAYTISLDGVSKAFAGTGVRVGWGLGPAAVIAKMKALMSHIGTWAPMAEQVATAAFLNNETAVKEALHTHKQKIEERLLMINDNILALKAKGYPIDAIAPQAAIYMTIKIDLKGRSYKGKPFSNQEEVTQFLMDEVGIALVPFYCFGADKESPWYRISVGTARIEDLEKVFRKMEMVFAQLN